MIVGNKEIKVHDRKIEAIREWPKLNTITGVGSFLRLAQFFRRYVPEFARIAYPLTNLTKKNNSISNWDAECQHAFQELKLALINSPVLHSPDWKEPVIGHVDASQNAVGGTFTHEISWVMNIQSHTFPRSFLPLKRVIPRKTANFLDLYSFWGVSDSTWKVTNLKYSLRIKYWNTCFLKLISAAERQGLWKHLDTSVVFR